MQQGATSPSARVIPRSLIYAAAGATLALVQLASPANWLANLARIDAAHPSWHLNAVAFVALGAALWFAARIPGGATQMKDMWRAQQRAEAAAMHLVRTDALTALPNRLRFHELLRAALSTGRPCALMLIRLEGLKTINNGHGDAVGDTLLHEFATLLRQAAPASTQVARLAGDEFALLLSAPPADHNEAERIALTLVRTLSGPFRGVPGDARVGASIGIALAPEHGLTAERLLRGARLAMDLVRGNERGGGLRFFEPSVGQAAHVLAQLTAELSGAIDSGDIIPYYQPIMELGSGALAGFEVLARWQHPRHGLLLPDTFIAIAEAQQLAGRLSQCLLRQVVIDAQKWPDTLHFAFNASPGQLRELVAFARNARGLQASALPASRIEVELTESALIQDMTVAREVVQILHDMGTKVVLDDFGVGYANLFHLRGIPFDRIKIDKSFVLDMARDPRAEACVRAMLALGHSLGAKMTAEGIETQETADRLLQMGCDLGQGYLFSRPIPASQMPALLHQLIPGTARAAA